jgi:hypothetical protein
MRNFVSARKNRFKVGHREEMVIMGDMISINVLSLLLYAGLRHCKVIQPKRDM